VLILEQCNERVLDELKKKNFINIVMVDAPFKERLSFYCRKNGKEINLTAF
jgi:phosphosulfolactate synthase (CoM biosynthesis protein A)